MKRPLLLAFVLLAVVGCGKESPPVAERTTSPSATPDRRLPSPSPVVKSGTREPAPIADRDPATREKPAPPGGLFSNPAPVTGLEGPPPEKRPDLPKGDPKSEWKELNQDKTLYLEMVTGADGKKKGARVAVAAEVVLNEGPLEVFMCKKNTKEHEAILRTDIDARLIHAALLAAGAKPGNPVSFFNPKTMKPEYTPASGTSIDVLVHYTKGGKTFTHPAQEWIADTKTKKDMAHTWVFAGSKFLKNTDRPDDPDYYCANNGEMIAISNFVDSMLDLPVEVSAANDELEFTAKTDRIPPLLSGVWVVLQPREEKKKQ